MRLATSLLATGVATLVAACAIDDAPPYDHAAEITVLGGGKADGPMPHKKWTFLLYGAADNNLAADIFADVNELESVGSTDQVNFLAFLDTPDGASVNYLLTDDDPDALTSPTASWGTVDSGDEETFKRVLLWTHATYPADHYAVVVSGHGGGTPRMIAPDDSTGHAMTVPMLANTLEYLTVNSGHRIEVFGADACLMQTLEVAYQFSTRAAFVVASENTEPASGWDYVAIGSELVADPQNTMGRMLATSMVEHFENYYSNQGTAATLAALSVDALRRPPRISGGVVGPQNAIVQLAELLPRLRAFAGTPEGRAELREVARLAFRLDAEDPYVDAHDLLDVLAQRPYFASIRGAVSLLRDTIRREVTIAAWIDPRIAGRAHGLSLYFPETAPTEDELAAYNAHNIFDYELDWSSFVRAIHTP